MLHDLHGRISRQGQSSASIRPCHVVEHDVGVAHRAPAAGQERRGRPTEGGRLGSAVFRLGAGGCGCAHGALPPCWVRRVRVFQRPRARRPLIRGARLARVCSVLSCTLCDSAREAQLTERLLQIGSRSIGGPLGEVAEAPPVSGPWRCFCPSSPVCALCLTGVQSAGSRATNRRSPRGHGRPWCR